MQFNKTLFFRKPITPWYDSGFICWTLIICMFAVFAFAITGIIVSSTNEKFLQHIWFPRLLALLSSFLAIKIMFRLKYRSEKQ